MLWEEDIDDLSLGGNPPPMLTNQEATSLAADTGSLYGSTFDFPNAMDLSEAWMMSFTNSHPWAEAFNIDLLQSPSDGGFMSLAFKSIPDVDSTAHSGLSAQGRAALSSLRTYFNHNGQSEENGQVQGGFRVKSRDLAFATPSLRRYDSELINLLATVAEHHLAKAFPILSVQVEDDDGSAAECTVCTLATAAVGGLYCDLPGRFRVVNAMYNDARRLFLPRTRRSGSHSIRDLIASIKTFILLEIYGICSGEKRSFELAEAYHHQLLSFAAELNAKLKEQTFPAAGVAPMEQAIQALSLSLSFLECYRVVLLLRPPDAFFGSTVRFHHVVEGFGPSSGDRNADDLVNALFATDVPVGMEFTYHDSARSLLSIAIRAAPNTTSSDSSSIVRSLWRNEYFELALSKWAASQSSETADASLWTLYHLICINLHTNINLIQRLVHGLISSNEPPRNDAPRLRRLRSSLDDWHKSRHYGAATWHSESILSLANEALVSSGSGGSTADGGPSSRNGKVAEGQQQQQVVFAEPPHLPYAIYSATLVLWCGGLLSTAPNSSTFVHQASHIDNSILLLVGMRMRIASLLQRPLRRLRKLSPA